MISYKKDIASGRTSGLTSRIRNPKEYGTRKSKRVRHMAEGTQRLLQRGENFILAYEDRNPFIVAPAYNEPITTLREIKLEPESAVDVAPSPGGLAVFQSSGVDVTNGVRRTARERKSVTPLKM